MTGTVLITDCDHVTVAPETRILEDAGFTVRRANCRSANDVVREGADALALLTQYVPVTREVFEALPRLQAVGRYGSGVDTVDVAAASEHGVDVVTVPDYAREEVSDHALALIFTLVRGITALDRSVKSGVWDVQQVGHLRRSSAMVVGVIGLGSIGQALAAKAQAVGFQVLGHDPVARIDGLETVGLEGLLSRSDVVSLHVPLTPETTHLIDREALACMRAGAYLVNTSRGGVVDERALVDALREGRIGGAALDVLAVEPPPADHPLLRMNNVVITPHAAFYSRESIEVLKRSVAERLVMALTARSARLIVEGRAGTTTRRPNDDA